VEARIKLRDSEKVMAVSPIGFAKKSGQRVGERAMEVPRVLHKRKPLESLVRGLPMEDWPSGYREILESARLAPSSS